MGVCDPNRSAPRNQSLRRSPNSLALLIDDFPLLHATTMSVYCSAGNEIATREHKGDFKEC